MGRIPTDEWNLFFALRCFFKSIKYYGILIIFFVKIGIYVRLWKVGGFKMLKNEADVIRLIQNDEKMMEIIKAVSTLNLPDWWICAGFIRSKIWDALHGFKDRTETPDVDVIYFDKSIINEDMEKEFEIN